MSAMEHLVPEQMFSTEAAPANGISAVKAIQLAAAEGQRIYTITRANVDAALAQINLSSDIEAEIRNAAQAGLEITAHQQPVSFFGRPSVGYIILDPVTATGAYKIGGGENGGNIYSLFGSALAIVLGMGLLSLGPVAVLLGLMLIYFATMILIIETLDFSNAGMLDWEIVTIVSFIGAFIGPFIAATALEGVSAALIGFLMWIMSKSSGE